MSWIFLGKRIDSSKIKLYVSINLLLFMPLYQNIAVVFLKNKFKAFFCLVGEKD